MTEATRVLTRNGQVTVPVEVRRALGLRQGDRITFILDKNEVRLVPRGSLVQSTAGLLRGDEPPLSAREIREAAADAMAEATVERAAR